MSGDEPAYPHTPVQIDGPLMPRTGLTKREHFAGLVLAGYVASPDTTHATAEEMAKDAVLCADALIAALNAGKEQG